MLPSSWIVTSSRQRLFLILHILTLISILKEVIRWRHRCCAFLTQGKSQGSELFDFWDVRSGYETDGVMDTWHGQVFWRALGTDHKILVIRNWTAWMRNEMKLTAWDTFSLRFVLCRRRLIRPVALLLPFGVSFTLKQRPSQLCSCTQEN